MTKIKGFYKVGDLLKSFKSDKDKYISREFQKYGYDLAEELGELKNVSLYIKLAKETNRALLERALSYCKDAKTTTPNKGALFMWKLKQLKDEQNGIKPPKSKWDK